MYKEPQKDPLMIIQGKAYYRKIARPTLRTLIETGIIFRDGVVCVNTGKMMKAGVIQIDHRRSQPVYNGGVSQIPDHFRKMKVIRVSCEWSIPRLFIVVEE